jgi:hypothetical protein
MLPKAHVLHAARGTDQNPAAVGVMATVAENPRDRGMD